jgi:hypothetical protein
MWRAGAAEAAAVVAAGAVGVVVAVPGAAVAKAAGAALAVHRLAMCPWWEGQSGRTRRPGSGRHRLTGRRWHRV